MPMYRRLACRLVLSGVMMVALAGLRAAAQFDNRAVHDRIKQDLKKHPKLKKISVTVDAGEVVLTGMVPTIAEHKQAGAIARTDAPGMIVLNYTAVKKKKKVPA